MDSKMRNCLSRFKPKKSILVKLNRFLEKELSIEFCVDSSYQDYLRLSNQPLRFHEEGVSDPEDGSALCGRYCKILDYDGTLGRIFSTTKLNFNLHASFLKYPSFSGVADRPDELLKLAEYHDFVHHAVDNPLFQISRRGFGLRYGAIAGRYWLQYFHLYRGLGDGEFSDIETVAHPNPHRVRWKSPVDANISMNMITPIAGHLAFKIQVDVDVRSSKGINAVSPEVARYLVESVASTFRSGPCDGMKAYSDFVRRNGERASHETGLFDWNNIGFDESHIQLGWGGLEEKSTYFNERLWFDYKNPLGARFPLSPGLVLNRREKAVQDYLRQKETNVQCWRKVLERLDVEPREFLKDTEHLIA
ncbi:hypothetical protein [Marinimicrobium locisalis]|uniref:hypothetical protein n=1 Tax=Marinimicrobium locisalis TaxID=546022 RepID=UPI00322144A7